MTRTHLPKIHYMINVRLVFMILEAREWRPRDADLESRPARGVTQSHAGYIRLRLRQSYL